MARPNVQYLDRYLKKIGASTVVVELEYNDTDYLDDYASYYVRCYPNYERFCRRIHFFQNRFEEQDLKSAIMSKDDSEIVKELQRSYLGFIVARPLPLTVIGRTLLASYPEDGRRRFPTRGKYAVSLFGLSLNITSVPYQEQDSVVSACATVAIWSALHRASKIFGTSTPRPMHITTNANQVRAPYGRSVPSHALTLEQMCQAVNAVGLEPEVYLVTDSTPLLSIVYAYLELGLPVIMGVQIEGSQGHAITITGASITDSAIDIGEQVASPVPMIGRRINELFVHDDGIGPFAWIRIQSSESPNKPRDYTYPVAFLSSWKSDNGEDLLLFPHVLVVPVHPKIRIRYTDIERTLRALTDLFKSIILQDTDLEWEPRVQFTNQYKTELRARLSLTKTEVDFLFSSQPRFIWRITLRLEKAHVADVIIDATDIPNQALPAILWRHERFGGECKLRWNRPRSAKQIIASRGQPFFDAIMQ